MGQTLGGVCCQVQLGGTLPGPAGGVPCQGGTLPGPAGMGTLPGPARGTLPGGTLPGPAGGYPAGGYPGQVPPPARSGQGIPCSGGYPARSSRGGPCQGGSLVRYPPGQDGGVPRQDNRRSTQYTAGSMPLAFTQEDFLVVLILSA